MNIKVTEKRKLNGNHWYRRLPRRWQKPLVEFLIKLRLIRRYGRFEVIVYDKNGKKKDNRVGYNLITDVGIKHLGDILVTTETTNLSLDYMEMGSGTTAADVTDTDTETPLTPADRLAATGQTRSTSSPFHVTIQTFIGSTKYTRPLTINEIVIFFGPDETGDIFARGVLPSGIPMATGESATITYAFIFR